jgi:riboflavin kinase/FMN adenylyltransferase
MKHFRSLDLVHLEGVWLTIGSFDGVHRGHQEVINKLKTEAHKHEALAVVLTFFPHPATVISGRDFPFYLTTPEDKARLMGDLGVDIVITHPFNHDIAATPASKFMNKLHHHLQMRHLKVGYDFALGRNREGNPKKLAEIGFQLGYSLEKIKPYKLDDHIVSSSRIRFLLGAGLVEEAARLLNRYYSVSGQVEIGDRRGQKIGFPTANLDIWKMRAIPTAGVYVCRVLINGVNYGAVTNIGVRPTFEAVPVPPRIEAHILDFQGDLYGETLELEFIARLRGEQRFTSVDDLITQIRTDIISARKILA